MQGFQIRFDLFFHSWNADRRAAENIGSGCRGIFPGRDLLLHAEGFAEIIAVSKTAFHADAQEAVITFSAGNQDIIGTDRVPVFFH